MRTYTKYLGFAALSGLVISGIAYAATQSVTATADFEAAVSLTKVHDINFGVLQAGTAVGSQFDISTAGVVTASNNGVAIGGTTEAAEITITGAPGQTVAINTQGYTDDSNVHPSNATCAYDGGAATACDTPLTGQAAPGVAGKTLLVGLRITTTDVIAAGTVAHPTFTVNVVYG